MQLKWGAHASGVWYSASRRILPTTLLSAPNSERKVGVLKVVVETTTTARETRALPRQLHGFGLGGEHRTLNNELRTSNETSIRGGIGRSFVCGRKRPLRAALKRTHSRRFAQFQSAGQRASVWSACASAPLFPTKRSNQFKNETSNSEH